MTSSSHRSVQQKNYGSDFYRTLFAGDTSDNDVMQRTRRVYAGFTRHDRLVPGKALDSNL